MKTDYTVAAHRLLDEIANDAQLAAWIKNLETLQRKSEEENWWNQDLGVAVENTLGYLRMGRAAASGR